MEALKSEYRKEKEAQELAVYAEMQGLMAMDGAMVGAVATHIMSKYKIHSRATVMAIYKRVKNRLNQTTSTNA